MDDVALAYLHVTGNSGVDLEMEDITFTITSAVSDCENGICNDDVDGDAVVDQGGYENLINLELYNMTTGEVYDLSYVTGSDADDLGLSKDYDNDDLAQDLEDGVTYEFLVRGDVETGATGAYQVSLPDASTDLSIVETDEEEAVTDITPNSITWLSLIHI